MLVNNEWVLMELFDGPLDPQIWIHWISLYSMETFLTMFIWPHQVPKKVKKRVVRVCQEKTRNF
jgi:hypothetical protein